jgi:hypothetical protein
LGVALLKVLGIGMLYLYALYKKVPPATLGQWSCMVVACEMRWLILDDANSGKYFGFIINGCGGVIYRDGEEYNGVQKIANIMKKNDEE